MNWFCKRRADATLHWPANEHDVVSGTKTASLYLCLKSNFTNWTWRLFYKKVLLFFFVLFFVYAVIVGWSLFCNTYTRTTHPLGRQAFPDQNFGEKEERRKERKKRVIHVSSFVATNPLPTPPPPPPPTTPPVKQLFAQPVILDVQHFCRVC